ncbi:hypothetical protein TRVA0_012S01002 [Trichomonascus vanleenenianus]|uniref:putative lipase n=1 Tax=Trichomonascus vanleenenianus TaxID=2268995 RepID=UPI003ECB90C3
MVQRAIEGVTVKAANDNPGSETWAASGLTKVTKAIVAVKLAISICLHTVNSGLAKTLLLAQDVLHIVNAAFGATESSRALRSVVTLFRTRLRGHSGLIRMLSGISLFIIVQSRTWRSSRAHARVMPVWDVVVLDNGETIVSRKKASAYSASLPGDQFQALIRSLPPDSKYHLTMSETAVQEYTLQARFPLTSPYTMQLPPGARIINENASIEDRSTRFYSVTFELAYTRHQQQQQGTIEHDATPSLSGGIIHTAATHMSPPVEMVYDDRFVKLLARFMRYSSISYGHSFMRIMGIGKFNVKIPTQQYMSTTHARHVSFAQHAGIQVRDIVLSTYVGESDDKAIPQVHFVSIDHATESVVLTIRGTLGLEDMLADFEFEYETIRWQDKEYSTHGGMLKDAMRLASPRNRVFQALHSSLSKYPSYGLVVCGHSLGGGIGSLFCILITELDSVGEFVTSSASELPAGRRVKCFAYGPPATISSELRLKTEKLVTSVVFGLDIVPCLSLGLFLDFQAVAETLQSDSKQLVHDLMRRFIAQLSTQRNPLSLYEEEHDDNLQDVLSRIRVSMNNEKLVPPGEVIHLTTKTVYEAHGNQTHKATNIVAELIVDVEKRYNEPIFGRGIFHHAPLYYERALDTLEQAICSTSSPE